MGLNAALGQNELLTDRNTDNEDPMHEVCIPHRIHHAWEHRE